MSVLSIWGTKICMSPFNECNLVCLVVGSTERFGRDYLVGTV